MAGAPAFTILEMIWTLISSSVATIGRLAGLFSELFTQMGVVSSAGPGAWIIAGVILLVVAFFLLKFVIGAGKNLLMLVVLGFLLLLALGLIL